MYNLQLNQPVQLHLSKLNQPVQLNLLANTNGIGFSLDTLSTCSINVKAHLYDHIHLQTKPTE
ncbi:unnamed protein product [Brassica napus]|uniref:(rape) hypothetical protein n=1 Tax=Brassica napus TaxID=3708 RepID=A0A816KU87_BRANA|nr:unnamed protein product [Brassica napus]